MRERVQKKQRNFYAKALSVAPIGVESVIVEVECQQSVQLPGFSVVGMPQAWARETRERVLGAIYASGFTLPSRRIVINLSPARTWTADSRGFDLPIAIACLAAAEILPMEVLGSCAFLGELTLSGALRGTRAARALPRLVRERALSAAYVALEDADLFAGLAVERGGGFHSLQAVVEALRNGKMGALSSSPAAALAESRPGESPLFEAIRGQEVAKRMLAIAAAGEHHALLAGPRGCGKSLLARAFQGILPPLDIRLAETVDAIHRASGLSWNGLRPFREPHSSTTVAAMIGGGANCSPGELSLAHGGVIFLDELLEFRREALEVLRVALESGELRLARGDMHVVLPAQAQLISATNLCPCGVFGYVRGDCRCSPSDIHQYRRRLSHALRDRIDLKLALTYEDAVETERTDTQTLRERCQRARDFMLRRQGEPNGRLSGFAIFTRSPWEDSARDLVDRIALELKLSLRGRIALARVARTIADLEESVTVSADHVFQAKHFQYDPLEPISVPPRERFSWSEAQPAITG